MQPFNAATTEAGLSERDSALRGLDFLWLELTGKCNLECVHCYADSGPSLPLSQSMRLADWKRVLAESYSVGCRKVQFIGGEPTIYPHIVELIQYARLLGYEFVEVFTNGTAFTEHVREAFRTFHVALAFSVYGDEAYIHDSVTRRAGSLAKTLGNIKWALSEGLAVRAAIVETSQNPFKSEATKTFLKELGVTEVRVDRIRGVGRGSTGKESAPSLGELCGSCWEGKLCVTATGDMFPCVFSRSWRVGTVDEGIKNVVEGNLLMDFRSTLRSRTESETTNSTEQCTPPPTPCGPNSPCSPDYLRRPGCMPRCNPS